jgi:hypothetical protein
MRRRAAALGGLCAAVLVLGGCGGEDVRVDAGTAPPGGGAGRAEALASCPAAAAGWEERAAPPAASDDPAAARAGEQVAAAAAEASRYLGTLPADQAGGVRVEPATRSVVLGVTRGAPEVRRAVQARVGPGVRVRVETVAFSHAALEDAARRIPDIPGLTWSSVGVDSNGRVVVGVPGDVAAARRLIAETVDPCMVKVEQEDQPSPATGSGVTTGG